MAEPQFISGKQLKKDKSDNPAKDVTWSIFIELVLASQVAW